MKIPISGLVMAMLAVGMLALAFYIKPVSPSPATITVPDDYSTVKAAINAAKPNDTVYVKAGTYHENVIVNRTLSIVGKNSQNTIIDGGGVGNALTITTDYVNVTGFTIRNGSTDDNDGISVDGANYCNISGNNITNNDDGIYLYSSSSNRIFHNNFVNNNAQVYSNGSANAWDDGYPSGGNYWSDYMTRYPNAAEIDGSGIWNTPYVIDANNTDHYPLMSKRAPTQLNPSTVGTSTDMGAVGCSFQRKSFFAKGRFWCFFSNGTMMVYYTSTDGSSWSEGTSSPVRACSHGYDFSIFFDGTYLHYAYWDEGSTLYYRRGTPNGDGSIAWSAPEQTVASTGYTPSMDTIPTIAVDSDGHPWIGWPCYTGNVVGCVFKSSTNDGSWNTAAGFPTTLYDNGQTSDYGYILIIPLTNQKTYAIYLSRGGSNAFGYGRLWNGSSWEPVETIMYSANTFYGPCDFSAVAISDDIYLIYEPRRGLSIQIVFNKRTYSGGWQYPVGSEFVVQNITNTYNNYPHGILSKGSSPEILYCFWENDPTSNHIYYKKYTNGVWDSNPIDWITETSLTQPINYDQIGDYDDTLFNSYYDSADGSYVGVTYTNGSSSSLQIRFAYLQLTPAIPEFQPFTPLPLFMIITLLTIIFQRLLLESGSRTARAKAWASLKREK
jgi:parallel beta-helix repeat protein